jgi:arylsulfatase A-like enzyme
MFERRKGKRMKAIMVMFDSLNRHMLPPYGCEWVQAPNFKRLAEQTVMFENAYIASAPCMPARRDLHTGRNNFLHRSWGPIEPFDDSMPEMLKRKGVYTHLTSDHYHYWEDGGCTYHPRYNTWEISRGQEGDPWKGEVQEPDIPDHLKNMREGTNSWRQDWVNRKYMKNEEDLPQVKTFKKGLEFINTNHQQDKWFLHIETFDPHEPYFVPTKYLERYRQEYNGPHFDWPNYDLVREKPEEVEHCRYLNAALISMCDEYLGKILDKMDELELWKDTMLMVNTDHGFLLGEHGWWAKMVQPIYNEISHIPLFIWDPRNKQANVKRKSLVQTIDLAPTLLDFFGIPVPGDMLGLPLSGTIESDQPVRRAGLFGVHGGHVNVTDGRYVYMRGPVKPDNQPLYDYTLMPSHMSHLFRVHELQSLQLAEPFTFTKGCKTLKIAAGPLINPFIYGSLLFDLQTDPKQENPINDPEIEENMIEMMVGLMNENDAPMEQFERLGLPKDGPVKGEHLVLQDRPETAKEKIGNTEVIWIGKGKTMYDSLLVIVPEPLKRQLILGIEERINAQGWREVNEDLILEALAELSPQGYRTMFNWIGGIIKEKGKSMLP